MKIRWISIAAVVLAGLITVVMVVSGHMAVENEYRDNISAARAYAEKGIPYNAYRAYEKAFAVRCEDEAIYQEYMAQAQLLGNDLYSKAIDKYVEYFPSSATAYELLCKKYYEHGSYAAVIETALKARELNAATEQVRDWYVECAHMLKPIRSSLEEAQTFLDGYARIKADGKYGYITQGGKLLLAPMYEHASALKNGAAAVYENDEWHMINAAGYVVARTNTPVDSMSILSDGMISVSKDGKYGYTNSALTIPEKLPFDFAGTFKNGVAAVKKGDKWALIGADGKNITEYVFEDVLLDEFDACLNGGVVFAQKDGKYYMFNSKGEQIGKQGFDNAYPFVSGEYAAVCVGKKWGFADTTGKIVIEPQYEDARSFNLNLGAVCIDGKWGYISTGADIRIECQYEDCLPFSNNGIAAVKESGMWKYVQLLAYYYG